MLKKHFIAVAATILLIPLTLFACQLQNSPEWELLDATDNVLPMPNKDKAITTIERIEKETDLNNAIELSDCAAIAEFVSYEKKDGWSEYAFAVKEVFRGDIPDKNIFDI